MLEFEELDNGVIHARVTLIAHMNVSLHALRDVRRHTHVDTVDGRSLGSSRSKGS